MGAASANLVFFYVNPLVVDKLTYFSISQGFGSAFFFCGSGSGQKFSCGSVSGSGSWGYPGEGAGGKGKK